MLFHKSVVSRSTRIRCLWSLLAEKLAGRRIRLVPVTELDKSSLNKGKVGNQETEREEVWIKTLIP